MNRNKPDFFLFKISETIMKGTSDIPNGAFIQNLTHSRGIFMIENQLFVSSHITTAICLSHATLFDLRELRHCHVTLLQRIGCT